MALSSPRDVAWRKAAPTRRHGTAPAVQYRSQHETQSGNGPFMVVHTYDAAPVRPNPPGLTPGSPQVPGRHGRRNGVLRSALAPLGRQRSTGRGAGAVSDERARRPRFGARADPGLLVAVARVARRGRPR